VILMFGITFSVNSVRDSFNILTVYSAFSVTAAVCAFVSAGLLDLAGVLAGVVALAGVSALAGVWAFAGVSLLAGVWAVAGASMARAWAFAGVSALAGVLT
jgi:hypothetical protein